MLTRGSHACSRTKHVGLSCFAGRSSCGSASQRELCGIAARPSSARRASMGSTGEQGFDAVALALDSIQGFSADEREAVVEFLKIGRARVAAARTAPPAAVTVFAERVTFPARWDGLQVIPPPQTSLAARAAYRLRKLDLLFEWLDTLRRGATALGHYTRQGIRARIVQQEDGLRCPVCESFNGHEVTHGRDTVPPIHPGCRCVLMAVTAAPHDERIGPHARRRLRASF